MPPAPLAGQGNREKRSGLAALALEAHRRCMESCARAAGMSDGRSLDAQRCDHAEVVAGVRALDGRVEAQGRLEHLAAEALVAAVDEDVVDPPVGLAQRRGELVAARVREAGRAVARE